MAFIFEFVFWDFNGDNGGKSFADIAAIDRLIASNEFVFACPVIDDLGQKNTGKEWLEDELFKLLDYRMTNNRMTLVTSNLDIKQLPFNERIKDRLEKITVEMHLPEVCVRTKEARENRQALFKELGLIGDRKE